MPDPSKRTICIGLAGFGNVGAGVYANLEKNADLLRERTGTEMVVKHIVVRDPAKPRAIEPPAGLLTTRWRDLIEDGAVNIIVELIGGTTEAFELVKESLLAGKIVVTGNKALLAERGRELFALAGKTGVPIYFEAAVAGGIPIIKTVQEAFVGNRIESMHAILNGTCNYILTRMSQAGISYEEALREAQELGYAEADPELDVSGWDAAHKALILASLSYGFWIRTEDVYVEGVSELEPMDFQFAALLGHTIKLLSVIRVDGKKQVEVRTEPSLLPKSHVLASVNGVYNAVLVRGDIVGETLFYGRGAGQNPTSSSVISDLADAAVALANGARHTGFVPHGLYGKSKPLEETTAAYYIRIPVRDEAGVLSQVTGVLGKLGISIRSAVQPDESFAGASMLVFTTHEVASGRMWEAVEAISGLDCVAGRPVWLRVESMND
jgi:homoserine dehydrogenase